jgi:hypothetical protein
MDIITRPLAVYFLYFLGSSSSYIEPRISSQEIKVIDLVRLCARWRVFNHCYWGNNEISNG